MFLINPHVHDGLFFSSYSWASNILFKELGRIACLYSISESEMFKNTIFFELFFILFWTKIFSDLQYTNHLESKIFNIICINPSTISDL